jgi:hypothetical protein
MLHGGPMGTTLSRGRGECGWGGMTTSTLDLYVASYPEATIAKHDCEELKELDDMRARSEHAPRRSRNDQEPCKTPSGRNLLGAEAPHCRCNGGLCVPSPRHLRVLGPLEVDAGEGPSADQIEGWTAMRQ